MSYSTLKGKLKFGAKLLARSRSYSLTRHHFADPRTHVLATYRWHGLSVSYRPGTSDTNVIYSILLKKGAKSEYFPPREFSVEPSEVRTVLDIGANAGISAIYFSQLFPNATVHAFEPAPSNIDVLKRNAAACGRIVVHDFALGDVEGELELFHSDNPTNLGGFSAHPLGVNRGKSTRVPVRPTGKALEQLGITSVDVVKVDTEGAEWEILTAMDLKMLRGVKLIMGELHGRRDFAVLDYLQPYFRIGLKKNIQSRLFNFYAVRDQENVSDHVLTG